MNRSIMKQDIHRPAFIRANVPNDQREQPQVAYAASHSSRINWVGVIKLLFQLGILFGGLSLLSKVITPQVITALAILIGFVVLRFIARTVLQITFTLLRYLFWIIVLVVILLCVL